MRQWGVCSRWGVLKDETERGRERNRRYKEIGIMMREKKKKEKEVAQK